MFSQVSLPEDFKETEIGPIPVDWEVIQISDVADIKGGGTPSTKKPHFWNGAIPFLTPSDVTSHRTLHISRSSRYITEEGLKQSSAKLMPPGSVLMTSRATIGEVAICDVPMATNQGFINIIVRPDELANELLAYWITWRKEFLKELGTGTTFKEVSKGVFKTVRIPLPPLPEQRRIAHVLSTIQRAIAAQDDLIAAAREVKRSLMQRLFTYGPDAEPAPTKETEIGEIPEHWEVVRLGEVTEKPQYGYTASASEHPIGPKFLRITDIQDGRVSWSSVPFCEIDERGLVKHRLGPGDLLFARIGATTGKTYLVVECPPSVFASYLIRVRVKSERLLPGYAHYFTNTETYWRQIDAAKGGRLKKGINVPVLSSLLLPLSPLSEQHEITHTLLAADRKIEAEEQRKAALQVLFKSMLHQLMTGQVRVPELVEVP